MPNRRTIAACVLTAALCFALAFYDAVANGEKLGCEISSEPLTHVDRGRFQIPLPDTSIGAIQSTADIWVDVQVDGLSVGRSKLGVVPYAVEAAHVG